MPLSGVGIHNAPIVFAESYHSSQSLSFLKWSVLKRNPNFSTAQIYSKKCFTTNYLLLWIKSCISHNTKLELNKILHKPLSNWFAERLYIMHQSLPHKTLIVLILISDQISQTYFHIDPPKYKPQV